jgi:hypothetical protein
MVKTGCGGNCLALPGTVNNDEIPDLTGLESENVIVRKKLKRRGKPPFTGPDAGNGDRQPEREG